MARRPVLWMIGAWLWAGQAWSAQNQALRQAQESAELSGTALGAADSESVHAKALKGQFAMNGEASGAADAPAAGASSRAGSELLLARSGGSGRVRRGDFPSPRTETEVPLLSPRAKATMEGGAGGLAVGGLIGCFLGLIIAGGAGALPGALIGMGVGLIAGAAVGWLSSLGREAVGILSRR